VAKLARHDLRRTFTGSCHASGHELEQKQFFLGHVSVQTTERHLGCKQRMRVAGTNSSVIKGLSWDFCAPAASDEVFSPTSGRFSSANAGQAVWAFFSADGAKFAIAKSFVRLCSSMYLAADAGCGTELRTLAAKGICVCIRTRSVSRVKSDRRGPHGAQPPHESINVKSLDLEPRVHAGSLLANVGEAYSQMSEGLKLLGS